MPSDPYPQSKPQRTEFGSLMTQILTENVRPYLAGLIRGDDTITNKSTLHAAFKKATGSTVSFSTFNGWLDTLGISFRKTVQVEGLNLPPNPVPAPGGAGGGPRPDAGEEEVHFDNETKSDFIKPRGFGDAFGELARLSGD